MLPRNIRIAALSVALLIPGIAAAAPTDPPGALATPTPGTPAPVPPSTVPTVAANDGRAASLAPQTDPRVTSVRDRLTNVTANIRAIRTQYDALQRDAQWTLRATVEQTQTAQRGLREYRRQARDAVVDTDKLIEDSNQLLKTQKSELVSQFFAFYQSNGLQFPPINTTLQAENVEPPPIDLDEALTRRARDVERMKDIEATLATPLRAGAPGVPGEDRNQLQFELQQLKRQGAPNETNLRRGYTAYESLRGSYQQLARLVADTARLRLDADRLSSEIDGAISDLFSLATQQSSFRQTVTAYFAAALTALIVGFFIVVALDSKVRANIFGGQLGVAGGQAGIQFVTIFALVIAIILFGVMGILEGKELSALLGGLSGYILGRGVGGNQPAQHQPPP